MTYIVSFDTDSKTAPSEVSVSSEHLHALMNLLEKSERVAQYKIACSQGVITKSIAGYLGFGGYLKLVESFNYPQNS